MDPVACQMPDCGGVLDFENPVPLQTGCSSFSMCFACNKCGRVHSGSGSLMFNRPGSSVYLREDRLELILEPKVLDPGKKYLVKAYLYVVVEGEDEDGCPNMDEVIPDTVLIFDHMEEDMFSFRDMSGKKFLLHRGDVNMIESA